MYVQRPRLKTKLDRLLQIDPTHRLHRGTEHTVLGGPVLAADADVTAVHTSRPFRQR